ncbi:MAG: OmpA family protein [Bacteroidetes bacterium]|nr:MAG: OmpA family protein [Bacteroidota bacterium]
MKINLILLTLLIIIINSTSYSQSYDFGKSKIFTNFNPSVALSDEIRSYLDALATYMHANEYFSVKVSGHSDNSGTSDENEKSSLERVKMISDYLLSKGITGDRIIEKAEGSKMPISPNDTPESNDLNNRVEISVLHSVIEISIHESKHEEHSNHISIFGGATTFTESKETYATAGLEFEHRFKEINYLLGLGIFAEAVFTEEKEYVAGIPIFIHPVHGLKFLLAPGVSVVKDNIEMLVRAGVGYDIYIGNFAITPGFNVDYVKEHFTLVYGISFGIGF